MCQMCEVREAAEAALDSNDPVVQRAVLDKLNGVNAAYFSNDLMAACSRSRRGGVVSVLGMAHALGTLAALATLDIEKVFEVIRLSNTEAKDIIAKDMAALEKSLPPSLFEAMKGKLSGNGVNEQFVAAAAQMVTAFKEATANVAKTLMVSSPKDMGVTIPTV